jgi:hypothetical protein
LRKRMVVACSEGGGVVVDGLRKRTAVVCSEAKVEDGRWWWWRDGF